MKRDTWTVVAVLLLVAACGGHGRGPTDVEATGATAETSAPAAVDGAALLDQAPSQSFQVVYDVRDPNRGPIQIIVANSPPAFAWRESDTANGRTPTFARHLIQVDSDKVKGCIWAGSRLDSPEAWECASSPPTSERGLFAEMLGGLLFGRPVFDAQAVREAGWETTRRTQILGREVVCGTSPAFASEITDVCLDNETGIPLGLERAGTSYTATAFGAPSDEAFIPPDKGGGG